MTGADPAAAEGLVRPLRADGENVTFVYERLRRAILNGEIAPGHETSQSALARELGVSRAPLHDALRILQREGLVLVRPTGRLRIAELSVQDLEELYFTRISLEAVAVRITVPFLGREDVAELEGLMGVMDAGNDAAFDSAHRAFHMGFVKGAGKRSLATLERLFDHAGRYRSIFAAAAPEEWPKRRAEHRAMLDAAKRGDSDGAAQSIVAHYMTTAKVVARELDPTHKLERLAAVAAAVAPPPPASSTERG